jgi:hypothetical protein
MFANKYFETAAVIGSRILFAILLGVLSTFSESHEVKKIAAAAAVAPLVTGGALGARYLIGDSCTAEAQEATQVAFEALLTVIIVMIFRLPFELLWLWTPILVYSFWNAVTAGTGTKVAAQATLMQLLPKIVAERTILVIIMVMFDLSSKVIYLWTPVVLSCSLLAPQFAAAACAPPLSAAGAAEVSAGAAEVSAGAAGANKASAQAAGMLLLGMMNLVMLLIFEHHPSRY